MIRQTRSQRPISPTASRGRGRSARSILTHKRRRETTPARDQGTDSEDSSSIFQPEPDVDDTFEQDNLQDLQRMRAIPPAPKRPKPSQSFVLPTLQNYRELRAIWGKAKAEEVLAAQPRTHNCLSPMGLFEAQGLQSQYDVDKTMLSLALQCSRRTLDENL